MSAGQSDDAMRRRCLVLDKQRLADVDEKHARVRTLLTASGADALLLQDPANIAWFTAGADPARSAAEGCQTSLFVTDDARLFATNAVDSAQLFEREAFGLGFQLKQREWFQPHCALVEDLCRGRKMVSDSGFEGTRSVAKDVVRLRRPLTDLEVDRIRRLSKVLVHAVEISAGHIRPGVSEASVAGELSHRLIRRTVMPVRIQVCADGRNVRYRHWSYSEDPIESYATISCVAKRWGLHVAVSRTVCLNQVPEELWAAHQKAVLIHATGMYFSRAGQQLKDIWRKVRRIYDKFGMPTEWQLADQAEIIGYRAMEHQLTPDSDYELEAPTAMYWHPGVSASVTGDTILVLPGGCEIVTRSAVWPQLRVQVKGHDVPCCGLLLIQEDSAPEICEKNSPEKTAALFMGLHLPDDDTDGSRMDSIWELDMSLHPSVFEESETRPNQTARAETSDRTAVPERSRAGCRFP
jgi:Xaa-Pro dipeptidase